MRKKTQGHELITVWLQWRGGPSKMCCVSMPIMLSWRLSRPCGLTSVLYLSLEECKLGPYLWWVLIKTFFYDLCIGQVKFLITEHMLLPSCKWPSFFLKPWAPHLILSSECHTYLTLTFCRRISDVCGVSACHACEIPMCAYVIKLSYFLLSICLNVDLIIRPDRLVIVGEEIFILNPFFLICFHMEMQDPWKGQSFGSLQKQLHLLVAIR